MAEHACIPVINALSDLEHPCQALADYFTLLERFGDLKKICLAYVGDGNSSRIHFSHCSHSSSQIRIATPEGYARHANRCRGPRYRTQTGAVIDILSDPKQAVDGVDAIYT